MLSHSTLLEIRNNLKKHIVVFPVCRRSVSKNREVEKLAKSAEEAAFVADMAEVYKISK